MSPLALKILLHYGYSPSDYRDGNFDAPAVRQAIDYFRNEVGMIEVTPRFGPVHSEAAYRLTERGQVFVDALCVLPLPEPFWRIPKDERLDALVHAGRAPKREQENNRDAASGDEE